MLGLRLQQLLEQRKGEQDRCKGRLMVAAKRSISQQWGTQPYSRLVQ